MRWLWIISAIFYNRLRGKKITLRYGTTSKFTCDPEMSLNHRHKWEHNNEPLGSTNVGQNILRNYRPHAASMDFSVSKGSKLSRKVIYFYFLRVCNFWLAIALPEYL